MNITAEEKLMYSVMKAIYDSGIPMNFKGSMVLKACLLEAGYEEYEEYINSKNGGAKNRDKDKSTGKDNRSVTY